MNNWLKESATLGALICIGLFSIGTLFGSSIVKFKELDRTVVAKGLSEREVNATVAIWPIKFLVAENELGMLYRSIEDKTKLITTFLQEKGFKDSEITISTPSITDKQANDYGNSAKIKFRYAANQTVTVYTKEVAKVVEAKKDLINLGKLGVTMIGNDYGGLTEYLYNDLNSIKPEMVQEATRKAREVAFKFAQDSKSSLGKIKSARQGQFSINNRDSNTPYIKNVRVVTTVEYYLSD